MAVSSDFRRRIYVEGGGDRAFLEFLFKQHEIDKDQYSIIELNGKNGISAKVSEIKRSLKDDRERIYVVLDTDKNLYEKKRKKFEDDLHDTHLTQEECGKIKLYLWPFNEGCETGALEDLINKVSDYDKMASCLQNFCECINKKCLKQANSKNKNATNIHLHESWFQLYNEIGVKMGLKPFDHQHKECKKILKFFDFESDLMQT